MKKPAVQAYFGRAKAACLRSYCCNRHLWCYDGGRLGRVKIVTLRVGAGAKEGQGEGGGEKLIWHFLFSLPAPTPLLLTRPIFSSLFEFQQGAFACKTFLRPKKTPALQASDKRAHARNKSSNLDVLNSEFDRAVKFSLTKRCYKHILTMNRQLVS